MKLVLQSLLLIASFAFVYVWQASPLAQYTVQAFGFFMFLFILISVKNRGFDANRLFGKDGTFAIFILNTIVLLMIFTTGSLSSTFFFLLYFLGFGVAFVFEPITVFVFMAGAMLIFVPEAMVNEQMSNFLKIGSLALICPLAYFFGREFRGREVQEANVEAMKERTKDAADTISKDVGHVLEDEKDELSSQTVDKLNEVLEEADDLRAETKEIK